MRLRDSIWIRATPAQAFRFFEEMERNYSTLRLGVVRVKRLTEEVAVVHARMHLSGQTPVAGVERPGGRTTVFSFVVHRVGQGWSCAAAQNTDVVPGMETNVAHAGGLRSMDYQGRTPTGEAPGSVPRGRGASPPGIHPARGGSLGRWTRPIDEGCSRPTPGQEEA